MSKKMTRSKTNYPGVYYLESKASDGRPEKILYIIYRKNGKLIEEKAGRQFRDAMTPAKASQIRTRRIEGVLPSNRERREEARKKVWTVNLLWQEYSSSLTNLSNTDVSRYQKHLRAALGDKEPKNITPLDVDRLRIKLLKGYAPQTVKHVLTLLQRVINYGVKKGLCPGIGFKIEKPKVDNLKTEDLNMEQMADLLAALEEDYDLQVCNLMRLALFTGMRRGELFKLQWQDIDFDRGFILIRDPKGGRAQKIPLNQAAREVLANHPRDESTPYVFPGRGGKQRTNIKRAANRIKKAAGLPADFRPLHGLRHVYASMLASSGQVDLYTLQKLLTHKSPQMTQRYAHLRDEVLRRASDLAGDLVSQIVKLPRAQGETD
jgi:integrase